MFLQSNFSIAALTAMTLIAATISTGILAPRGTISLFPTKGLAQTFSPARLPERPQPRISTQSCAQLVQRLNLSTAQQEQAVAICDRTQGRMTTESITALRSILDENQLTTFDQKIREVQMQNYSANDCEKSEQISSSLPESKCR